MVAPNVMNSKTILIEKTCPKRADVSHFVIVFSSANQLRETKGRWFSCFIPDNGRSHSCRLLLQGRIPLERIFFTSSFTSLKAKGRQALHIAQGFASRGTESRHLYCQKWNLNSTWQIVTSYFTFKLLFCKRMPEWHLKCNP